MSATQVYTLGLSKIEVGTAESTSPATILGYTNQDSCTFTQEDPTVQEFYAEEVEAPVISNIRAGAMSVEFDVMNPSVDSLALLMGGTAQSTSGESWEAPDQAVTVEKSIKITPAQGFSILMPRARLDCKFSGGYSKNSLLLVHVKATCLQPATQGTARITLTKITPAVGS